MSLIPPVPTNSLIPACGFAAGLYAILKPTRRAEPTGSPRIRYGAA